VDPLLGINRALDSRRVRAYILHLSIIYVVRDKRLSTADVALFECHIWLEVMPPHADNPSTRISDTGGMHWMCSHFCSSICPLYEVRFLPSCIPEIRRIQVNQVPARVLSGRLWFGWEPDSSEAQLGGSQASRLNPS
jgi:hypothetical protein